MNSSTFLQRLMGAVVRRRDQTPAGAERRARKTFALFQALLSQRGEASGAALAREALDAYGELGHPALERLFDLLAENLSPDPDAVARAADTYRRDASQENLVRLQQVVEAPRQELFRRLNMAPGGTVALVEMRRRVLEGMRSRPQWAGVDADLAHLLASWFNRGFLELRRIDWRTSALMLEKLIAYEAVHEIKGWSDLRRRLEADRRCFAFFHPALVEEPIIFIEVALARGMSEKVQPLLDASSAVDDPEQADCAVFYSITNCQQGLRGISFGSFLIKQVAEDLAREFPRIKTFATLSPIPGFRQWLASMKPEIAAAPGGDAVLARVAALERPGWHEQAALASRMRQDLMRLCARYLLYAKRGPDPLDAVARFHLGNGAAMARLNWLADTSAAGIAQSGGLMVNYVYGIDALERNHEAYENEHRVVSSARLRALARACPLASRTGART